MDIEVNDLSSLGVIKDEEGYQLPPEAFTYGNDIRFFANGVEKLLGRSQVFGTPGVAPHFAMSIASVSQTYWLYVSLTKGYVYDGSSHTDITRAVGGDYTAGQTRDWNGALLGGVPILNNGSDDPQYWASLNPATKLAALPNWPASTKAKVIRAFGPYLLALNVTKAGTIYPHMVKWSHPADPGSVPSSWDPTDATKDAGEKDLPDTQAGVIHDGLPLGNRFYVYKAGSVWRMTQIGGNFIFDFGTSAFIETAGILGPRCVTITGDGTRHVFASQDDILVHNGNTVESILNGRYKRYLSNVIDQTNYLNCFMFTNPFTDEIVFCYPETGATNPNRALIWNYRLGQKGAISESAISFRNAALGNVENPGTAIWSTVTGTWDTYVGPWQTSQRRKVIACSTDTTKFLQLDSGVLRDGATFTATLQREGLSMVGRKRSGEWINDFKKRKLVHRVWIKAQGGPIDVRLGSFNVPLGATTWSAVVSFDPTTQDYVDVVVEGAAISIEFSSANYFRLTGYKLEIELGGEF